MVAQLLPPRLLCIFNILHVPVKLCDQQSVLSLEAELLTAIQEANHLIFAPAFSPSFYVTGPVKLKVAKDIVQSILKCDLEALLDKQCYKDLKEAFKIIELENELHDLEYQIEALQAQFADCQSQKEVLQAKLDAELDQLRPEKEALLGKCKLFTAFKERLPEMKNRINAGIGVWEAFKAALNIQFRGVN
ncbi:hypothetical protein ACLB2K_041776 [Fragaria x ananassa]